MIIFLIIYVILFTSVIHVMSSNILSNSHLTLVDSIHTCPEGFVIPDDPSDSRVHWVSSGNICAHSCLSPTYTTSEWITYHKVSQSITIIGLPFVIYLLVNCIWDKKSRKKYLVVCFVLPHAISCFIFLIVSSYPLEDVLCKNNAVRRSSSDGFSLCSLEGVVALYSLLAGCLSWCMQSIDLFIKVVYGVKHHNYWMTYLFVIFGLPLVPVTYFLITASIGSTSSSPYCFIHTNSMENMDIIFFLITIVTVGIGFGCMIPVMHRIVKTSTKASKMVAPIKINVDTTLSPSKISINRQSVSLKANPDMSVKHLHQHAHASTSKLIATTLLFVLMFISVWLSWYCYRGILYTSTDSFRESLDNWTSCVFDNWDDENNSMWKSQCGSHPSNRMSVSFTSWSIICFLGQSLLVSSIFLSRKTFIGHCRYLKSVVSKLFVEGVLDSIKNQSKYSRKSSHSRAVSGALSEIGLI